MRVLKKKKMKDNWVQNLVKRAYSDRQIVILKYDELKDRGLTDSEIVDRIARGFLDIGFDLNYWKRKVIDILKSEDFIQVRE